MYRRYNNEKLDDVISRNSISELLQLRFILKADECFSTYLKGDVSFRNSKYVLKHVQKDFKSCRLFMKMRRKKKDIIAFLTCQFRTDIKWDNEMVTVKVKKCNWIQHLIDVQIIDLFFCFCNIL